MGRFKAEAIIVRKLPNLEIIFWDSQSIYVYDQSGGHIFNRWFAKKGSYTEYWQDFRRKMLRNKFKCVREIYELSLKYDGVLVAHTDRRLDLKGKKIKYLYVK